MQPLADPIKSSPSKQHKVLLELKNPNLLLWKVLLRWIYA